MIKKIFSSASIILALSACGGDGSGGGIITAVGQFKDSNTGGLSYVSGDQVGTTDSEGRFTYEVGKSVTFSIGGITLGTSNGKAVITPVDLVPEGSLSSVNVQNIVRFLMMLDDDGNPSNGINISPSILLISADWQQVDFTKSDFSSELTAIVSDASSVDGGVHSLPSISVAKEHLESTLLCSYAGAYTGSFSGEADGKFGFMIDAVTGSVVGVAGGDGVDDILIDLNSISSITHDQFVNFETGNYLKGVSLSGSFSSVDDISGEWSDRPNNIGGGFSGSRIGGDKYAEYRFTGEYTGGDSGLFSFDIDSSNNVTGVGYSYEEDDLFELSGTVSGTNLSVTTSTNSSITGFLNILTGELNGNWEDSTGTTSGIFSGRGCHLN